jgi:hypothetical protein
MNMRCVCGARIPVTSRFSICEGCMNAEEVGPGVYRPRTPEDVHEEGEQWIGGYGADESWEVAYWRKRALAAEGAERGTPAPAEPETQRPPAPECEDCGDTGKDDSGYPCDCPTGEETWAQDLFY